MQKKNYIASLFEEIELEEVLFPSGEEEENQWNTRDQDGLGGNTRDDESNDLGQ